MSESGTQVQQSESSEAPLTVNDLKVENRLKLTLGQKMSLIREMVPGIPKRGRNAHFGYDYVKAEDAAAALGKWMAQLGVNMYCRGIRVLSRREVQRKNGTDEVLTCRYKWVFVNADNRKEKEVHYSLGAGQDTGDKCVYKAQTGAMKYAFISAFQLEMGIDPEVDSGPVHQNLGQGNQRQGKQEKRQEKSSLTPEQQALKNRVDVFKARLLKAGHDKEKIKEFTTKAVGDKRASEWTPEDFEKMEKAVTAFEIEKGVSTPSASVRPMTVKITHGTHKGKTTGDLTDADLVLTINETRTWIEDARKSDDENKRKAVPNGEKYLKGLETIATMRAEANKSTGPKAA